MTGTSPEGEAADGRSRLRGLAGELAVELDRAPPTAVAGRFVDALESAGFGDPVLWLVDLSYSRLADALGEKEPRSVEGSVEGRAIMTQAPVSHDGRLHLPLARRGQEIGVLSLDAEEAEAAELEALVLVATTALLATTEHSDVLQMARGAHQLSLPATIQYQLLPLPSYADDSCAIGGQVEPAYDIAGDAFDYAVNRDSVHFAVLDAVGHGLRSTLITTCAMGAYRRERRHGRDLRGVAAGIDSALRPVLGRGEFVTGILMQLIPEDGTVEIWNAGHLPPLLVRDRKARPIETGACKLPFGLGTAGEVSRINIQAGDLVILYTDGVVQARDEEDSALGYAHLADLLAAHSADLSVSALCRRALQSVAEHVGGPLADDATILALRIGPTPEGGPDVVSSRVLPP